MIAKTTVDNQPEAKQALIASKEHIKQTEAKQAEAKWAVAKKRK